MIRGALRVFGQGMPMATASPFHRVRLGSFLGQDGADIVEELRRRGPVLPVQVGISKILAKELEAQGQTVPPPEEIPALVDTGASITAIHVATAERLGLPVTGSAQIGGATGISTQPVYTAMLRIPDPFIEYDPIQLSGAQLSNVPFEMLIGRNILCKMLLAYDGRKGRFSLMF